MSRWDVIDRSLMPDEESVMYLSQRGSSFVIHVDGRRLMDNFARGSEVALAELACERVPEPGPVRVLVGGLGMGFTLAAALRCVPAHAEVTVAELMPPVVEWNRQLVGKAAGWPLLDPRARVHPTSSALAG